MTQTAKEPARQRLNLSMAIDHLEHRAGDEDLYRAWDRVCTLLTLLSRTDILTPDELRDWQGKARSALTHAEQRTGHRVLH